MTPKKPKELSPKMRGYIEGTLSRIDRAINLTASKLNENPPNLEAANRVLRNLSYSIREIKVTQYGFSKHRTVIIDKETKRIISENLDVLRNLPPKITRCKIDEQGCVILNGKVFFYGWEHAGRDVMMTEFDKDITATLVKDSQPVVRAGFWRSLWLLLQGYRPGILEELHYIQNSKSALEKSEQPSGNKYPIQNSNPPTLPDSQQSSDEKGFPQC